jgi:thioredoxin 1
MNPISADKFARVLLCLSFVWIACNDGSGNVAAASGSKACNPKPFTTPIPFQTNAPAETLDSPPHQFGSGLIRMVEPTVRICGARGSQCFTLDRFFSSSPNFQPNHIFFTSARLSERVGDDDEPGPDAPTERDSWTESLDDAIGQAKLSGKPILLKFEAEWCGGCNQLTKEFAKPAFRSISDSAILVRIDVDRQPDLATDYDISSIPKVILLDSNEAIVAEKTGSADVSEWVTWLRDSVKDTEFEIPDVLQSGDPPTRTETKELIETLGSRDPALRQITMERLVAFPEKTRDALVDSLTEKGKLAQKLSVLEVLDRWQAPVAGLDPWVVTSFTPEKMEALEQWKETSLEDLETSLTELTEAHLQSAADDIDDLLKTNHLRAGLARMTRYGAGLLPTVYQRIAGAESDQDKTRLTALRYWLTASNGLRLGWASGLIELASPDLSGRRAAASVLIERATLDDQMLLMELFADSDPLMRELCLKGLQKVGAKETDAALAKLLYDPDLNVRAAVLKSFAESERTQMVDEVAEYLETETDADLIVHALRYLKSGSGIGAADSAVASMLSFVEHESWQVRAEVAESLGTIDADDLSDEMLIQRVEAMTKLLGDDDGFVVSKAATGLPRKKNAKLMQQLVDIAKKNPEIASQIAESLEDGSYGDNTVSHAPFLKQMLAAENELVKTAGLTGMMEDYPEQMNDAELAPLLGDSSSMVRESALAAFFERLDGYREASEQISSADGLDDFGDLYIQRPEPRPGILGWLGFTKSPDEESPDEEDAEAKDEAKDENEPDATTESEDGAVAEKPKLPPLAEEEWLKKWLAGEIKTKLDESIIEVKKLAKSEQPPEKLNALAGLVALGDASQLPALVEAAGTDPESLIILSSVLKWLPPEPRTELFKQLLEHPGFADADHLRWLLYAYTKVRNPDSAAVIWGLAGRDEMPAAGVHAALMQAWFGGQVSRYTSVEEARVLPELLDLAVEQTKRSLDSDDPKVQKLTLIALENLNLVEAQAIATDWLDSGRDPVVRDLAMRILLLPPSSESDLDIRFGNTRKKNDRTQAISYLETDEAWQYKIALQFLAFGDTALDDGPHAEEALYLSRTSTSTYYSSSSNDIKVRIPKPPKGLTEELLNPKKLKLDVETQALVTYFRALSDPKTELAPLVAAWKKNPDDQSISKLMYEAIASTNRDDLVYIAEDIFDAHGVDSNRFASELYWTIRVMDGKTAISLRKRIRDEVGMDTISNY